jgi:hypothetical protein
LGTTDIALSPRWVATLVLLLAFASVPAAATAEDPIFFNWSADLPAFGTAYDPGSENDCTAGRLRCVDRVIREMTKRFNRLADRCDHDAVFSLTYLRTTEEYRRATTTPGFFEDAAFVNHEDAVFASYYFAAYDDWHGGHRGRVPLAWRIALDAADRRQVSGTGNMLLGMSAHINRDLPYVLAGIGLAKPDGSSRKPDHDKVNEFLNRVTDELVPELARRFDPTVDDSALPTTLDDFVAFQAIPAMREGAWRNAERLANAATATERAAVEQSIENFAAAEAQAIKAATAYLPLSGGSTARDAYCSAHHDG